MNKTASDRILALSATISMPPYQWHDMRPHCRTCANLYNDRDGHRWERWDRDELRERGAEELECNGAVKLLFPLSLIWITEPHCFLHEVWPEWDGALRGPHAFGVQDMTKFTARKPLTWGSFTRRTR